jgi:catechol 2,3-dioxygenase-like lactoylglutathione lyase family enzyme
MSTELTTELLANAPFRYDGRLTAALSVSDLDVSIPWYAEMLGFELIYRLETWGWCELKSSVRGVSIGLGESDQVKTGGGATLTFNVRDIEEARDYLEARGVRFDGETSEVEGMVKLATFYDPDGNSFMLAQTLDGDKAGRGGTSPSRK